MTESIIFADKPISIFQSAGMNGKPSRQLFIDIADLASVPEELFALKVSQSKNPELAGKPVFKYLSHKISAETPFSPLAPSTVTMATPLADIKALVVSKLGALPDAKFSFSINLNGSFTNIKAGNGTTYTIFDDKEFAATEGKPGYYLKGGTVATVELTLAQSNYDPYYRVSLETKSSPNEIFVHSGKSKVWGADDATDSDAPAADAVW